VAVSALGGELGHSPTAAKRTFTPRMPTITTPMSAGPTDRGWIEARYNQALEQIQPLWRFDVNRLVLIE
jgi:hypothetical protein